VTPSPDRTGPLGVFDSGLGGLTVARRLRETLPDERIVYVADQAHVPYGGRALGEVCGFACGISEALLAYGCKAVVMACNISSATALPAVQADHPGVPILGVLLPGAASAAVQTVCGRVGVLATEGTVRSGAYTRALRARNADLQVTEIACPAFVPLVEAGELETDAAFDAARAYLAPLRRAGVDTVILGCTHYPFLLPTLRALAPDLRFVDPAEQTALEMRTLLARADLLAAQSTPATTAPPPLLTTTGDVATFTAQTRRFLPDAAQTACIAAARWERNTLRLVC
jgi:glutamate racemase